MSGTNKTRNKKYKINHGDHMIGACYLWITNQTHDITDAQANMLVTVYMTIVKHQFQYRKHYCFIKSTDFPVSDTTRKRTIKKLKDLGYIDYKRTMYKGMHALTRFTILEPNDIIANFTLVGNADATIANKPTHEPEPINLPNPEHYTWLHNIIQPLVDIHGEHNDKYEFLINHSTLSINHPTQDELNKHKGIT
ncbi:hypothetical protein DRJ16_07640 [Candidatus Woesearchaeota archaeon]|nr:MAG: hypothetical protein DRJ16_07640 [Candidatus Woesearchaeota archaeon]